MISAPPLAAPASPFTPEEVGRLRPFVTNLDQPVFALRNLPEEVIAVLFAYYSRSTDCLRRNLLKLLAETDLRTPVGVSADGETGSGRQGLVAAQETARQFHERWVVGYGHASVAEHAVVHLAVENVSIVLSKVIEDARLASFTEKSTRYVVFDRDRFYREPAILASRHGDRYVATCTHLLDTYSRLIAPVMQRVAADVPRNPAQSDAAYQAAVRAKACDVLRYLLPAAILTNLGLTVNARSAEAVIAKLLSHPLTEAQVLGERLKTEAQLIIPTLIKYAAPNAYRQRTQHAMAAHVHHLLAHAVPCDLEEDVKLVRSPQYADDQLIAAILYGFSHLSYSQLVFEIITMASEKKAAVLDEYLHRRGPHDAPLRALEHLTWTFEVLLDYGAYRDIQRHRICTQTPQESTALHGYSRPEDVARYGLTEVFAECMAHAQETYCALAPDLPAEAPYVLPLAFRKRVLLTMNLRELFHFIELRSSKQGHVSYRRIAQQMFRALERVHPLLARYVRVDLNDYTLARS